MTTNTTDVIAPVELEGFTGREDHTQENARYHQAMQRWQTAHPGAGREEYTQEGMRLIALNDVLRRYNTLRYHLIEEEVARNERDKALQRVEDLWEVLGDPAATGSWPHTHQAYVRAVDDARITIGIWKGRALGAKLVTFVTDGTGFREEAYRRILAAGHPPVEPMGGNPAKEAEQLLADVDQAHEYRQRLAAQTLRLMKPTDPR
ncbi:hypothetical protein ACIG63_45740 [Streptomyces antimycoticus]|uniref:hypothetical protein n=1 Tax=Streptomyces antimycoticus TaxID=68175 RepID=UPI0037CCD5FD